MLKASERDGSRETGEKKNMPAAEGKVPGFSSFSRLPTWVSRQLAVLAAIALVASVAAGADPLRLRDVLTEALQKNPGYLAARADRGYAENAHSSAGMAGYLPTVQASGGLTWSELDTRQETSTGVVTENSAATSTGKTAGVNANWTLFEGFAGPLAQKRLRLERDQARASEHLSREELLRRAALAYADLARQARLRDARDTVLTVSEERMRILETRLKSGSAGRPEWLEGRVDRNADHAALLQQEATLYSSRLNLAAAMGRDAAVPEEADNAALPSDPLNLPELKSNLKDRQPALQFAEANRDIASVALHQAAAPWYPRLDATAGYNYAQAENDVGFTAEARSWGPRAGLQLTVTLFDGELPWRVQSRGRLAVRSAELRLRETEFAVQSEVDRAYSAWTATDSAATLEREGLGYARENLGLTMIRWKSGTLSYLEARLAQVKYLDAFTRAENAQYEAFRARLDVLRAAGRMDQLVDETAADR
jgi:outer membrane protein